MIGAAHRTISAGARSSPLSRAQALEIEQEIQALDPAVHLSMTWISTLGDKDKSTPLSAAQPNFFTKELDELLLAKQIRIAIHSAKDLPNPLPKGLEIFSITKGVDPQDTLVLNKNISPGMVPNGVRIGTSSGRRREAVSKLFPSAEILEIRGTIDERLSLIEKGVLDGIVVAQAALVRLKKTALNTLHLNIAPEPLQGQLAVVGRRGDFEMKQLFKNIDTGTRPGRILVVGPTVPSKLQKQKPLVHIPLIKCIPLKCIPLRLKIPKKRRAEGYAALILTSAFAARTATRLFLRAKRPLPLPKTIFCVGRRTSRAARQLAKRCRMNLRDIQWHTASEETQEGLFALIQQKLSPGAGPLLWPKSTAARGDLLDYLQAAGYECAPISLYHPTPTGRSLFWNAEDTLFFTCPSSVQLFFSRYAANKSLPILKTIGPITEKALIRALASFP